MLREKKSLLCLYVEVSLCRVLLLENRNSELAFGLLENRVGQSFVIRTKILQMKCLVFGYFYIFSCEDNFGAWH